jgi:hypothetical protein
VLGLSAAVFGRFVERRGPRVAALLAAGLFSAGHLISGLAVAVGSLPLFFLGYGVVGGVGLGIGYIAPVSTLVKWFPDRRGMATGMAVLGFGAGALLASPVAARLIEAVGMPQTFALLGVAYLFLMTAGALYIERPPEGWAPAGPAGEKLRARVAADLGQLTSREALRTARFWMLWVMMFINISAGIKLISVASPLAQEKVGMTAVAAAAMVGLMGLFNGAGRIGWASLSDYIGPRQRLHPVLRGPDRGLPPAAPRLGPAAVPGAPLHRADDVRGRVRFAAGVHRGPLRDAPARGDPRAPAHGVVDGGDRGADGGGVCEGHHGQLRRLVLPLCRTAAVAFVTSLAMADMRHVRRLAMSVAP